MQKNTRFIKILISSIIILSILSIFLIPKIKNKYFPFTTYKKVEVMTTEKYLSDLDYLNKLIVEHFPYLKLKEKEYDLNWDKEYKEARLKIKEVKSDKEFEDLLNKLLEKLKNAHTRLLRDGNEVANIYHRYHSLPSKISKEKVSSFRNPNTINHYDLNNSYIKKLIEKENGKNSLSQSKNFTSKILVPNQVAYGHINQLISKVDGKAYENDLKNIKSFIEECKDYPIFVLDIRGNGGGDSNYWQQLLLPLLIQEGASTKVSVFMKNGPLFPKNLKEQYKKVDSLQENEKEMIFGNYPSDTMKFVSEFPLVSTSKLSVISVPENHFKGNLYLLVDRKVYSSSEMLAAFCKQTGVAKLVGERTGGDGIGSDPFLAVLPHSGIIVRFAKEMGVLENGSINELEQTTPDYIVANPRRKSAYNMDGEWDYKKDNCIKKIFELEDIIIE